MAVAKKDQERATCAWMYGAQSKREGLDAMVKAFFN